ncbi:hydrogenase/reductase-like protein [Ophiobolus disseminans]|uniref:Hydrogenase/reductase-like protein n=1 Tax=Ophiobolus disseminans TaxID=1469910 RepID=A0A6A6ZLB5_9PLEO|nr:hydrogenase/reductase-like protein [Ophiobolus disseminans]
MVALSDVLASNAQIQSNLPKGLIAIFAGATSGIGEVTLKTFVRYAVEPRIYIIARNQTAAERVIAECRQINAKGQYEFIYADLMLIKETDRACEQIKRKEKLVNLVVLSAGQFIFDRKPTSEGLNALLATGCYSRFRIAQQLLPLLTAAASTTPLARVVNVSSGTYEGDVVTSDMQVQNLSFTKAFSEMKPHVASIATLYLEALADQAPTVSFVHDFPGPVYSNLHKNAIGVFGLLIRVITEVIYAFLGRWLFVPIEESGERHVYFATSKNYRPRAGTAVGMALEGVNAAEGSDGLVGSGVYSINWDGEKRTEASVSALKKLRAKGVKEIVWDHVTGEFDRITAGM